MKVKINDDYALIEGTYEHQKDVQDIVFEVLEEYGLIPAPKGADADLFDLESVYKTGYFGVIVDQFGKIVGTCGLFKINDQVAEIRKMYILKTHRGKGLGKWCVNFLIDEAKRKGFSFLELETASPLKEAIGLYEKIGFQEIETENQTPRCDKMYKMTL